MIPVLFAIVVVVLAVALLMLVKSIHRIGPAEVGLVTKKLAFKKLEDDNPIAFLGEAGYQAQLLMPGLRYRLWPVYTVSRFSWVQVPAGEVAVVIAQVGEPLPIGAKSAEYREDFGNFSELEAFLGGGGQKGVQRPVLPPGTLLPIHPVAFLVITSRDVFGVPVAPELASLAGDGRARPRVVRPHARAAAGGDHRPSGERRRGRGGHHPRGIAARQG